MRTRRSELEREAAISRRLAQLGDELAGVRPARPEPTTVDLTEAPWWDEHTRPAPPRRPSGPPTPVPRPLPGASPPRGVGGRHAAPGPRPGWAGLGPAQLAVVAVVVAVGLAVTCWWLVRGSAEPASELTAAPARGLVSASPAVEAVGAPAPSSPAAQPATVTIDVAGRVRHPGIAVLDAGARVVDALQAAGGVKPGVDVSDLNLARLLVDGEQVLVGLPAPSGPAAGAAAPSGAVTGAPATLVNLNTATEAELDMLPEVGPVTAASILAWRDQHGGFTSVQELLEVDGIGEVTLSKLVPFVTV
jgi:competence protein ComEA